jgi:predicted small lipoprotein YifL
MVPFMSSTLSRPFLRLAVAGALVATLGLAGCGRKGPLDPPPSASVQGQAEPQPAQRSGLAGPIAVSPFGGGGSSSPTSDITVGPDGQPVVRGPKRSLPLDVLLN